MSEELDEYTKRLRAALDWAYRTEEGRFLLQHILRISDLFTAGGTKDAEMLSAGRRSVALQLLNDIDGCRSAVAIKKTILCKLVDETEGSGDVEEQIYDPLAMLGTRG